LEEPRDQQGNNPFSIKATGIPESFHSFETGAPFHKCLVCGINLANSGMPYFIEKAFRKYPGFKAFDITYEFAMCFNCAESLRKELSIESQERMKEYMESRIDFGKRRDSMSGYDPSNSVEPWLDHCLVTGESLQDQNEYVLYGYFQGNNMMVSDFPYAIGPKAMDELTDLLSNKTLGEMDNFMGQYFTGPPEVNELFKPRRPVLL
jgi:hypothetical protein